MNDRHENESKRVGTSNEPDDICEDGAANRSDLDEPRNQRYQRCIAVWFSLNLMHVRFGGWQLGRFDH